MNTEGPVLKSLGWNPDWETTRASASNRDCLGRVIQAGRLLVVQLEQGEVLATCPDHLEERPVCGDWVLVEIYEDSGSELPLRGRVADIVPRRIAITRRAVGFDRPQTLAANIDDVLIVCGLDRSQGIRSLPRYQALFLLENANTVVVLNKADLSDDVERDRAIAESRAPGLDVVTISALYHQGIELLAQRLQPYRTVVLLGPSGAGKSTIINALTGQHRQMTGEVRTHDRRGRHTTSTSQLVITPSGVVIMDTPGLRELGLWQSAGVERSYEDILELAGSCRFSDCKHDREPGCHVRWAVEQGLLSSERFLSYLELSRECETRAKLVKGRKRRYG